MTCFTRSMVLPISALMLVAACAHEVDAGSSAVASADDCSSPGSGKEGFSGIWLKYVATRTYDEPTPLAGLPAATAPTDHTFDLANGQWKLTCNDVLSGGQPYAGSRNVRVPCAATCEGSLSEGRNTWASVPQGLLLTKVREPFFRWDLEDDLVAAFNQCFPRFVANGSVCYVEDSCKDELQENTPYTAMVEGLPVTYTVRFYGEATGDIKYELTDAINSGVIQPGY